VPNPGQEPSGARFWAFGAWNPAIESAFCPHWERAVLGQILARSLFGAALKGEKLLGKALWALLFGPGKGVRHAATE